MEIVNGKTQNDTDFYTTLNRLADGNSFVAGTNDYKVTQSGTPGMSVVVTAGSMYAYIGSKSSYFEITLSTNTTLSVGANASGSTRIDIVCVKFDTSVSSDSTGSNIGTLQYVTGTAGAGVPATPANYTKLAEITVANGASSIVNANITDRRVNLTLSIGANQFVGLVNGTPSNPPAGTYKLYFKTDGNIYMLNSSGTETQVNGATNLIAISNTATIVQASDAASITTEHAIGGLTYTFTPTQNCHVLVDAFVNFSASGSSGQGGINISVDGTDRSSYYPQWTNNSALYTLAISDYFSLTGGTSHTILINANSSGSAISVNTNRGAMRILVIN